MKTISSESSLLLWKYNTNGSGITESNLDGDTLFLKKHYASLFREVSKILKDKIRVSFVDIWQKECANVCRNVFKSFKFGCFDNDDVDLVVNKFQGNCGEILVEMLAENGILDFIEPESYKPVDPVNERFIDAEALRNGLPIGIQVKNYSRGNLISHEVLTKAAAMSDLWLRHDKRIKEENVIEFLKSPCQYVVSLTDVKTDLLTEMYLNSVVFLGPKWLDMKKIQGSASSGENAKWRMFEKVADEIDSFQV